MLTPHARDVLMLGIGAAIWPAFALTGWVFLSRKPFQN